MQDFGFALPLYKTNPNANAWYVHVGFPSYDLRARIIDFEIYHPVDQVDISPRHEVRVGDPTPCAFLWEGRLFLDAVGPLFEQLAVYADIRKLAPGSWFDLVLYSRNRKVRSAVAGVARKLRSDFNKKIALKWFLDVAFRQVVNIDLDLFLRAELISASSPRRDTILKALREISLELKDGVYVFKYPEPIEEIIPFSNIDSLLFTRTVSACEVFGVDLVVISGDKMAQVVNRGVREREAHKTPEGPLSGRPSIRPMTRKRRMSRSIIVVSKGIDVSDTLRGHMIERLDELSNKFEAGLKIRVAISREGSGYKCNIRFHDEKLVLNSSAEQIDPYLTFDYSFKKLEVQVWKRFGSKRNQWQNL